MQIVIEPNEIEKFRKEANLTQKELAKLCKVSQSFIAKLERGEIDPAFSKIKALSEALIPRVFDRTKKVSEIMTRNIIYARRDEKIRDIVKKMAEYGISQLPIIEEGRIIGSITEQSIIEKISKRIEDSERVMNEKVENFMGPPFPIVPSNAPITILFYLFLSYQAVLVSSNGKIEGIVTKADLLAHL
ncbi:MAG TPA: CBS domain-containing protein [Geobacterales bacterium]|nr:CBS domain-containing protein [Geobacterales bacterium]